MARSVRISACKPYKIEPKDFPPDGKSIWICACGLSRTMPYCDKSHKVCEAEQAGTLYTYDPATAQVTGTQPDPHAPPPPLTPTEPRP